MGKISTITSGVAVLISGHYAIFSGTMPVIIQCLDFQQVTSNRVVAFEYSPDTLEYYVLVNIR